MTTIVPDPALFAGAVSFSQEADTGLRPWRLPVEDASLFPSPDDGLFGRAGCPSGVRLRFATDSPTVRIKLRPVHPEEVTDSDPFVVDLTSGGELIDSQRVVGGEYVADLGRGTPASVTEIGDGIYEVWLSPFFATVVEAIEIEDGARFGVPADDRPRWVAYGSSITMCRQAHSPARTWPATAARALDLNLTSLGFGGQCHLDPMVGRVIRDLPADVITLKLGINVYGAASLNARSYPGAVIGLLATIRDRHPLTPIGVITSIASPPREQVANAVGCTLEEYRGMTRDAVARLQAAGDRHLHLFEGADLFADSDAHLLPDNLHPNGDGYELMGRRAADAVLPQLLADVPRRR